MDESFGAQYALQIALQTLKERCQQFQERIITLEEENANLRNRNESNKFVRDSSLPDIDMLRRQIAQLTEQKTQLTNNIQMVSSENRRLWSRLSKLTQANENLGSKLHKINDTLSQHNCTVSQNPHAPALIRSKTFTQDEPHLKFLPKNVTDENDKINLELEDISLKLLSTIAREKCELELQCSQMTELQSSNNAFLDSFAFTHPFDRVEETMPEDFDDYLRNLKMLRGAVLQEKEKIEKNIYNLQTIKSEKNFAKRKAQSAKISVSVQTMEESLVETPVVGDFLDVKSNRESLDVPCAKPVQSNENEKICPICSKIFPSSCRFIDFQNHVESHFTSDSDDVGNFEIIP